jgi:hypothetical protein
LDAQGAVGAGSRMPRVDTPDEPRTIGVGLAVSRRAHAGELPE